jgi:hypothetical protein
MSRVQTLARWLIVGAVAVVHPSAQEKRSPAEDRNAVLARLETMIATGVPADIDHGEGEWLQAAVNDLIARADREVEQVAIRAAAPLRVTMSIPVSPVDSPPHLVISARNVLQVPAAVPYTATIYTSIDGGELVEVWTQESGKSGAVRLDERLGETSIRAGGHHVRVRAYLTFGHPDNPSWTEVRDLPELFYALYDLSKDATTDGRSLLYGPAAFTAADFDPALPQEMLETWLQEVLTPGRRPPSGELTWMPHYCALRTADPKGPIDDRRICAVLYFQTAAGTTGQVWFRTAEIQLGDDRVTWVPLDVPRFEGIVVGERNADRLSAMADLLHADPAQRPGGDAAIGPGDISVRMAPGASSADVSVTVHNRGHDPLFNVLVWVEFGSHHQMVSRRSFTVSIPPAGTAVIRTRLPFPARYGWIMTQALQRTEHGPSWGVTDDPTPEDACALRVLNAQAAPRALLAEIQQRSSSCQVRVR